MLYRIDKNTMIDLPAWKCREEFRDYYLAKLNSRNDVDLLARLKAKCDDIKASHERRQAASRRTATRMWQRPGERDRVDWSQAKPVDVFDFNGTLIASYPSSRKAAIALFGLENYRMDERNIRQCRMGLKKSHKGFMYRDHQDGVTQIEPYKRKERPSMKGRHYNRRPNTFATQPVAELDEDGRIVGRWDSIKEACRSLGLSNAAVYMILQKRSIIRKTGTTLIRIGRRGLQKK